jgi:hypothetical protein
VGGGVKFWDSSLKLAETASPIYNDDISLLFLQYPIPSKTDLQLDTFTNSLKQVYTRIVIASKSYCSEHIEPVIAFYSYRSDVIDQHCHIYSLSLFGKITFKSTYNIILFAAHKRNILQNNRKRFCQCVEMESFFSAVSREEGYSYALLFYNQNATSHFGVILGSKLWRKLLSQRLLNPSGEIGSRYPSMSIIIIGLLLPFVRQKMALSAV